ncbi:pyridoxamine 5'-phosphate oxidase family protein [Kitasatospora purpeofusca]|uniref:pyridoxamine 5'-phosphate oxidase family protein n=1 Tax=Kitasatospora purpeofusca TaxID=67352 RepID=UPI002E0E5C9A|nr:pyridoxamine 5'-phosphate oxidase family protein [Kitasatospora purpeofusca]
MDDQPVPSLLELPRAQALVLLAGLGAGRLVADRAAPGPAGLVVVNHLVEGERVYLRVHLPPGGAGHPQRLTYLAQRIDPEEHTGWLVRVTGAVRRVVEPGELARYRVPMRAWPDEDNEHLLLLRPERLTAYHLTRGRW